MSVRSAARARPASAAHSAIATAKSGASTPGKTPPAASPSHSPAAAAMAAKPRASGFAPLGGHRRCARPPTASTTASVSGAAEVSWRAPNSAEGMVTNASAEISAARGRKIARPA